MFHGLPGPVINQGAISGNPSKAKTTIPRFAIKQVFVYLRANNRLIASIPNTTTPRPIRRPNPTQSLNPSDLANSTDSIAAVAAP